MKKTVLVVIVAAVLVALGYPYLLGSGSVDDPIEVRQIAKHERAYDEKTVFVRGFIGGMEGIGIYLFPSEADANALESGKGITNYHLVLFVSYNDEGHLYPMPVDCLGEYVTVHGKLSKRHKDHVINFSEVYTITINDDPDGNKIGRLCMDNRDVEQE